MAEQDTLSRDEVLKLLGKQRIAMLTTLDPEGKFVSRPMTVMQLEDDGTLWFFTKTDTSAAEDLRREPRVQLSFADGNYLSVSGNATMLTDPAKAQELWNPFAKSWFQCEPTDPEVSLLKVVPESIAYWETPSSVGAVVGMVAGLVSDKQPPIGESGVVEL